MKKIKFILIPVAVVGIFLISTVNKLLAIAVGFLISAIFMFYKRSLIYHILSNSAYRKKDLNKAFYWMEKAYKMKNSHPKTNIMYGYLLLKSGDVEKAENVLSNIINSNIEEDDKMLAKANYALVLWKKNQLDKAIGLLEEVIKDYKNSTVYGSLGYLLIIKKDYNRALEINVEAYEYNNVDQIIMDNLGCTYYMLGEMEKSKEVYEKLMGLKPSFPEAYYNYSILLKDLQKYVEALEMIKKAESFKLSFLSALSYEDINMKIKELEDILSNDSK